MSVSPLNLLSKKTPAQMRENPKITGELNFTFLITFLQIKVYKSDFLRCIWLMIDPITMDKTQ